MSKEPLQPQDKYVLRLPDGMRDRIKTAAEKNNRSMNAEIIKRLEEAYEREEGTGGIKFDMQRLSEDEKKTVAEYLAQAALVLIRKHPEQAETAKKSRAATVNAMLDEVLDEGPKDEKPNE